MSSSFALDTSFGPSSNRGSALRIASSSTFQPSARRKLTGNAGNATLPSGVGTGVTSAWLPLCHDQSVALISRACLTDRVDVGGRRGAQIRERRTAVGGNRAEERRCAHGRRGRGSRVQKQNLPASRLRGSAE